MPRLRTEREDWARALKCDRGAVMVATIFMTLILVAVLYMVIGLGRTIVMKEGMQDAADAAAYSSAIFNARGMNLIVFINLLMAALVSILIAIRVAQSVMTLAAGILAGMAFASMGGTGPLAAQATYQAIQLNNTYNNAKKVIDKILEALHTTQQATSAVVPWVAMTRGMTEAAIHHDPARGAFAIPGSIVLPVESDEFSELCGRGGEFIAGASVAVLPGPLKSLADFVPTDAIGEVAELTSGFLCGDGGGEPPNYRQTINRELPRHPNETDCQDQGSAECTAIANYMTAAEPSGPEGECSSECHYDGPYETQARAARVDCEPRPTLLLENFVWQEREVTSEFTYDGAVWVETNRNPGRIRLEASESTPPCGIGGSVNNGEWNSDSGPRGSIEPHRLCREEIPEIETPGESGERRTATYEEVVRIFSCTRRTYRSVSLASSEEALGGSGSESKSPHRLQDVELGSEPFQIRAIAFGEKPGPGDASQGVVLADRSEGSAESRWDAARPGGEGEVGDFVELVSNVGRVAVAQAEFYFDGKVESSELMWQMKWTARLRHFRLPSQEEQEERDERNQGAKGVASRFGEMDPGASPESLCQAAGGDDCEEAAGSVSRLDKIVRH